MHGNGQSQPTRRQTTNHHQQRSATKTNGRGGERDGRGWDDAITNFLFALKTKAEHAEEEEEKRRRRGAVKGSLIEQFAQLLLPPSALGRHLVRWTDDGGSSNVRHFKWPPPPTPNEARDICQIIGSEMETEKRIREGRRRRRERRATEFDRQATEDLKGRSRVGVD